MAQCDQLTANGAQCKRTATIVSYFNLFRRPDRYCKQHAQIHNVPNDDRYGRVRQIDPDGNPIYAASPRG